MGGAATGASPKGEPSPGHLSLETVLPIHMGPSPHDHMVFLLVLQAPTGGETWREKADAWSGGQSYGKQESLGGPGRHGGSWGLGRPAL